MKWNASAIAAFLLLAGCGGDRGPANYAPEVVGPPPGSLAAQSWGRAPTLPAHGASGIAQAPFVPTEPVDDLQAAPGASYAPPGAASAQRRIEYAPPPAQQSIADPAAGATGPSGSSQRAPGEQRYDEVGYAGITSGDTGVTGIHRSLPVDSLVEVTSLENGRTIVVLITASDPGAAEPIALSAGAARALGHDGGQPVPVRVRRVAAGPGDLLALRAGQPAAARPDTPPVLLNALRKHLAGAPVAAAEPRVSERPAYARPSPPPRAIRPAPAPRPVRAPAGSGFYVQLAALSNAKNAQALAQRMHGSVKQGGGLHRVQLGPYATRAQADAARAGAARAGYGDARVIAVN